jgi:hypothetical protein
MVTAHTRHMSRGSNKTSKKCRENWVEAPGIEPSKRNGANRLFGRKNRQFSVEGLSFDQIPRCSVSFRSVGTRFGARFSQSDCGRAPDRLPAQAHRGVPWRGQPRWDARRTRKSCEPLERTSGRSIRSATADVTFIRLFISSSAGHLEFLQSSLLSASLTQFATNNPTDTGGAQGGRFA